MSRLLPLLFSWIALSACSADRAGSLARRPVTLTAEAGADSNTSLDAGALEVTDSAVVDSIPDASDAAVEAPTPPAAPRLGSIGRITWIYPRPTRKSEPIGSIRPGTAVRLRSTEPTPGGEGCPKWYAVEPQGFVCLDSKATLDLDKEPFKALAAVQPKRGNPFPYRYAYSLGSPMYGRAPDKAQQDRVERAYRPLAKLSRNHKPRSGHEELATDILPTPSDPVPYFVTPQEFPRMPGQKAGTLRWEMPEGVMLSFSAAFNVGERTFLLSPDLSIVPADRMRPFRPSSFQGVALDSTVKLPIAWIRKTSRTKYRKAADGSFSATAEQWAVRSWIGLTGQRVEQGGQTYLETRDSGLFLRLSDATVVEQPAQLPFSIGPQEKWIDVSIDKGTLTLFVGSTPVFSTLMSPGAGGVPPASAKTNEELVKGSYTPLGIYRINFKVRETTMTPEKSPFPEKNWIADVPHTLYFRMPFAIHAAYWHEDFGQPKSGGCINLSPIDARFVFDWAEPAIPDEWSGISGAPSTGLGTKVAIHR